MSDTVLTNKDGVEVFRGTLEGDGSQAVLVVTKEVNNAEILALPTTPIQVLASQGAGKITVPLHATLRLDWTADYADIDGGAAVYLILGTGQIIAKLDGGVSGASPVDLLAGGEAGTAFLPAKAIVPPSGAATQLDGSSGYFDSDVVDKAVFVKADNGADFSGGDPANVLTVTLLYYVVTL